MCNDKNNNKTMTIINAILTAISTIIGALFMHSCLSLV